MISTPHHLPAIFHAADRLDDVAAAAVWGKSSGLSLRRCFGIWLVLSMAGWCALASAAAGFIWAVG